MDNSVQNAPFSIESEQAIIGCSLLDSTLLDLVSPIVSAEDFHQKQHQLIFSAMSRLVEQSLAIDPITVAENLNANNELDAAGGSQYLIQLSASATGSKNIKQYAEIVADKAVLRRMMQTGREIHALASENDGGSVVEKLTSAQDSLFSLLKDKVKGSVNIKDLLIGVIEGVEKRSNGEVTGLMTEFTDMDAVMGGMDGGDLIVIAARPSMGKTALAMQIATNVARQTDRPIKGAVSIFSLEMPKEQLANRLVSQVGHIDFSKIRSGLCDDEEFDKITSSFGLLSDIPLFINDTAALTVQEISSICRAQARSPEGLGLVVIDYLQLMGYAGKAINRSEQVNDITKGLKSLAKTLNVPIILLSQLNRKVEDRGDKRPLMSDLRESGGIEQDADVIIMLYRDEYYNSDTQYKGIAEAIFRKVRNGSVGSVPLEFHGNQVRFANRSVGAGGWVQKDD